jgi:hypothetical protein
VITKQALGELLSDDPGLADEISAEMLRRERHLRNVIETGVEAEVERSALAARILRFCGLSSVAANWGN